MARFHIEFEGIHPFIDGNGRTERFLVNLEVMKADYPPIDIKFTDRVAYYNAFNEYHGKHNLGAMEKLFAGYVNERLDMYLKMLQEYITITLIKAYVFADRRFSYTHFL